MKTECSSPRLGGIHPQDGIGRQTGLDQRLVAVVQHALGERRHQRERRKATRMVRGRRGEESCNERGNESRKASQVLLGEAVDILDAVPEPQLDDQRLRPAVRPHLPLAPPHTEPKNSTPEPCYKMNCPPLMGVSKGNTQLPLPPPPISILHLQGSDVARGGRALRRVC